MITYFKEVTGLGKKSGLLLFETVKHFFKEKTLGVQSTTPS